MFLAALTLALISLQVLDFNLGLQEQVLFFLMLLLVRVVYYGVDLHTIISRKGLCTHHRIHKGVAHTCMPWSRVTTSGWVPASAVPPVRWAPVGFIDYVAETAWLDAMGGLLLLGQLLAVVFSSYWIQFWPLYPECCLSLWADFILWGLWTTLLSEEPRPLQAPGSYLHICSCILPHCFPSDSTLYILYLLQLKELW